MEKKIEFKRKIEKKLYEWNNDPNKVPLIVDGLRQIGKSYIVDKFAHEEYENVIVYDFRHNKSLRKIFDGNLDVDSIIRNSMPYFPNKEFIPYKTILIFEEIGDCPLARTSFKSFALDKRYAVIATGSLLGVLNYRRKQKIDIPTGYETIIQMTSLDFEEFLWANGFNKFAINSIKLNFENLECLEENLHNKILDLFKKYLLVGGLPDAVNTFVDSKNIYEIRKIQTNIHDFYGDDASKYDKEYKLKIKRIYDLIPSNLENKKKRVVAQEIENIKGKRFSNYQDEFDYLISSGIAIDVKAISNPTFPLIQSNSKNLLKLYLNDVGILTNLLYKNNANAILNDQNSINLGTVYESVVASELKAHGYNLFYYDNKTNGEVDFLIDDYDNLTTLPLEIKSGKDYLIHSAMNKFLQNKDYNVKKGYVFSNERKVFEKNNVVYMPIYYIMFFKNN